VHDAARLELAQARGEDVRADPGEPGDEVGVPPFSSSRTTSSAQRSPTSDRACATGQYWSNRFAIPGAV
jgi:hypothetical protein